MAKAHDRIQPMQITNLPTTTAAPGPFEGTLDADEPVPLGGPLGREDTNIGQVQRHLNEVVHGQPPVNLRRDHLTRVLHPNMATTSWLIVSFGDAA
jgi:hypothetical protein